MKKEIDIEIIYKILQGKEVNPLPSGVEKALQSFIINNKIIKSAVFINEGTGTGIIFNDCIFEHSFNFRGSECKSSFVLSGCTIDETVSFGGGNYNGSIHITNSNIKKGIFLSSGHYRMVYLNCSCEGIHIENCKVDELWVLGGTEKRLKINEIILRGVHFTGNILFSQLEIGKLELVWFLRKDSEVFISGINVRELLFSQFINDGKLMIFDLEALTQNDDGIVNTNNHSKVQISSSYLGRTDFHNVNFSGFSEVVINNSSISNCYFINTIWPKSISTSANEDKNSKDIYHNKREVYKQIKQVLSKQGDSVAEQHYHELEMNAYNRTLSYSNNFWTKIIIKLSDWTSKYGQSFWRPVVTMIVINASFFWLLYSIGQSVFTTYDLSKPENYINTVAEFIRILNPLHKNEPELKGLGFILDTIIRIISSYCIYNIIRATRRFVK